MIIANQAKFDVFNAVTLMDNVSFLEDLKVSCGSSLRRILVLIEIPSSAQETACSISTFTTGERPLWQVSKLLAMSALERVSEW